MKLFEELELTKLVKKSNCRYPKLVFEHLTSRAIQLFGLENAVEILGYEIKKAIESNDGRVEKEPKKAAEELIKLFGKGGVEGLGNFLFRVGDDRKYCFFSSFSFLFFFDPGKIKKSYNFQTETLSISISIMIKTPEPAVVSSKKNSQSIFWPF